MTKEEQVRADADRIRCALRELNTALANAFKNGVRTKFDIGKTQIESRNMDGKVQTLESATVVKLNDIWVEEKL